MTQACLKHISSKYCPRLGQIPVGLGFITELQMMEAFRCQLMENLSGQEHRLLGQILMDHGWITSEQIEIVLIVQLKRMRQEDAGHQLNTASAKS